MTGRRLENGGLIDRNQPLRFGFDGREMQGFAGDTLTSALLANGVRVVGRSFKYHRPRGVWGAWVDDPNAVFDVTRNGTHLPNVQGATTPLAEGMALRAVNAWPSAERDLKGGLDLFHRWLGAGFYYKTFIWPDWHLFEPAIRRMAGLGRVKGDAREGFTSDKRHQLCDCLVIGGGAAGLAAARAAAEAGRDVLLVDDRAALGGGLVGAAQIDGEPSAEWIAAQRKAIETAGGRILTSTTAFGIYDHQLVALAKARGPGKAPRLSRVRARRVILATGALDRPLTFANNDKPGVMSLEAAGQYLRRYGVLVGEKIAVAVTHSLCDPTITALQKAGAEVIRLDPTCGPLCALGGKVLTGVELGSDKHAADALLVSGGLTPLVHLWRHAGGKLDWDEARNAFLPANGPDWIAATGAAAGLYDLAHALDDARAVATGQPRPEAADTQVPAIWPDPQAKGRQWIDFQHDVTLKDIKQAAQENYASVEHLKRYTTLGMAVDQGKTSNMAGLATLAALQGKSIPETGTTTFRPPYTPVPLELYRGPQRRAQGFNPLKRLPLEGAHRKAGAALGEYGGWLRPAWYGAGQRDDLIVAEALRARQSAGLFDASPLGKIEVMGPDAEAFVNFVYYNTIRTLKPGHMRYGFMLTEQGKVFDDGVIARLGAERFLISCSSSHADAVALHLDAWRQDGNDPDRIFIHDLTQAWATLAVTGPRAREVLARLALPLDLSREAFPHMHLRETEWQGGPLRIARVSFTGDLSFELSVKPTQAQALWDCLLSDTQTAGGGPLGIEALSILRAEKGFIMVGKDTDGETMPHDLGFTVPRLKKTAAFVGDRSLHMAVAKARDRRQLVGLSVPEGDPPLPTGAHLVTSGPEPRSIGIVTSSYHSPTLDRPIALALLERGGERHGDRVQSWHLGDTRAATVTAPCALDPEGGRLDA